MEKTTGGMNKFPAMVLYIIAVVCLLAGLVLPFNANGFGGWEDMLILQIPAALGSLFGFSVTTPAFAYSGYYTFFGVFENINLYAIIVLLYAVLAVVAVCGLVVVFVTNRESNTALNFAGVIEAIAVALLGFFLVCELINNGMGQLDYWKYNIVGACGGVLLVLIVQAIIYRKTSGVVKTVLLLLSAFALLVPFVNSYNYLAGVNFVSGLTDGVNVGGLVSTLMLAPSSLFAAGEDPLMISLKVCLIVLVVLLMLNALLDMLGLAKTTQKFMLSANLARYTVAILAFLAIVILLPLNELSLGCDLITVGIAIFVALIINVVRYELYAKAEKEAAEQAAKEAAEREAAEKAAAEARAKAHRKGSRNLPSHIRVHIPVATKGGKTDEVILSDDVPEEVPASEGTPEEVLASEETPDGKAEPLTDVDYDSELDSEPDSDYIPFDFETTKKKSENEDYIYRVGPLYHGPSDSFIDTLSNSEKVEFAKIFLERKKNALSMIPSYVIDEDNSDFFSAVFIYYGKVRDLVSSGLMSKIYAYANKNH